MSAGFVNVDRDTPLMLPPRYRRSSVPTADGVGAFVVLLCQRNHGLAEDRDGNQDGHTQSRNELEQQLDADIAELLAEAQASNAQAVVDADGSQLIERFEADADAPELYLAISATDHDIRRYAYRPPREQKERTITDPLMVAMREKVRSEDGRKIYRKRKRTVEPVFGIIKSIMGLDQFLRRGFAAVNAEWYLVCTAYNMKRLWRLWSAGPPKPGMLGG